MTAIETLLTGGGIGDHNSVTFATLCDTCTDSRHQSSDFMAKACRGLAKEQGMTATIGFDICTASSGSCDLKQDLARSRLGNGTLFQANVHRAIKHRSEHRSGHVLPL